MNNRGVWREWERLIDFGSVQCDSILDLGTGGEDAVFDWWRTSLFEKARFRVGVEAYHPSVLSKARAFRGVFLHEDVLRVLDRGLLNMNFDVVVMSEFLEHLNKDDGLRVLVWAVQHYNFLVLVNTPFGLLDQCDVVNPYQYHRSGWLPEDFEKLGFATSVAVDSGGLRKLLAWRDKRKEKAGG